MTRRFNPDPLPRLGDQAAVLAYLNNNFNKLANLIDFDSNAKGILDWIELGNVNVALGVAGVFPGNVLTFEAEAGRLYKVCMSGLLLVNLANAIAVYGIADMTPVALKSSYQAIPYAGTSRSFHVELIWRAPTSGQKQFQDWGYVNVGTGLMQSIAAGYPFQFWVEDMGDRA